MRPPDNHGGAEPPEKLGGVEPPKKRGAIYRDALPGTSTCPETFTVEGPS